MILATVLLGPGSELTVGDAIRSVADAVDGFVLIDSGGGGQALRAAYEAASKQAHTAHYDWVGDYGAARQFALDEARRVGATYAVTLDPDERLVLPPDFRQKLSDNADAEVFLLRDRDEGYFKERVLRCSAPLQWIGRVCEFMAGMSQPQVKMGGHFFELPKDPDAHRRRWERGVVECQRMIDAGDDRYRWRRHMGSCLMGLDRREEALAQYRAAEALAVAPEEKAWIRYLIIEQLVIDENIEEAFPQASVALAEHAGFIPEFGWILGYCELKRGNWQNASRWAQLALHTPADRTRVSFRGSRVKPGCEALLAYLHAEGAQERMDGDFTAADFQHRKMYGPNYRRLGKALVELLGPDKHLDLGAGQGLLVEAMQGQGVASHGIELSASAKRSTVEHIRDNHMTYGWGMTEWHRVAPADLVSSVEVLEHLPESDADQAVATICGRSTRWVYFSAAAPGQAGKGHVNCQPKKYWRAKFEAHGFRFAEAETAALVAKIRDMQPCWWLPQNAMIFRKEGTP